MNEKETKETIAKIKEKNYTVILDVSNIDFIFDS